MEYTVHNVCLNRQGVCVCVMCVCVCVCVQQISDLGMSKELSVVIYSVLYID